MMKLEEKSATEDGRRVMLSTIQADADVQDMIRITNEFLGALGRIQHDEGHARLTAELAADILSQLGYPQRECELAAIAGYLHDLGNLVNRYQHGFSGALLGYKILRRLGMKVEEIGMVIGAIGNHEENTGANPVNAIAAAVILADKSNVHKSRVRKGDLSHFSSRDRVNFAAEDSQLLVLPEQKLISMRLAINTQIVPVIEYFEIFLVKMKLSREAAIFLGCQFELVINGTKML